MATEPRTFPAWLPGLRTAMSEKLGELPVSASLLDFVNAAVSVAAAHLHPVHRRIAELEADVTVPGGDEDAEECLHAQQVRALERARDALNAQVARRDSTIARWEEHGLHLEAVARDLREQGREQAWVITGLNKTIENLRRRTYVDAMGDLEARTAALREDVVHCAVDGKVTVRQAIRSGEHHLLRAVNELVHGVPVPVGPSRVETLKERVAEYTGLSIDDGEAEDILRAVDAVTDPEQQFDPDVHNPEIREVPVRAVAEATDLVKAIGGVPDGPAGTGFVHCRTADNVGFTVAHAKTVA